MTDEKANSISKTSEAQVKVPSIGNKLKAARLKKGRTIEAVNQETRMSRKFIVAMEEDRFDEIPGGSYLRSFLKGYCEYLDIDFNELGFVEDSKAALDPEQEKNIPESSENLKSVSSYSASALDEKTRNIVIVSALLILVVAGLFIRHGVNAQRKSSEKKQAAKAVSVQVPASPKPVLAPKGEASLVIDALKPNHLVVSVDGNIKFRGLAAVGTKQTWWAKREFILWTSSSSALGVSLNGKPYFLLHPDIKGNYHIRVKKRPALKLRAKHNSTGSTKPAVSPMALSPKTVSFSSGTKQ